MTLQGKCILNCQGNEVRLFEFPSSVELRKEWLECFGITNKLTNRTLFVCERHFSKKMRYLNCLKQNAKPDINLQSMFPKFNSSRPKMLTTSAAKTFRIENNFQGPSDFGHATASLDPQDSCMAVLEPKSVLRNDLDADDPNCEDEILSYESVLSMNDEQEENEFIDAETYDAETIEDTEYYEELEAIEDIKIESYMETDWVSRSIRREKMDPVCGLIELKTDRTFNIRCFYCKELWPIVKWSKFISHIKMKHKNLEKNYENLDDLEDSISTTKTSDDNHFNDEDHLEKVIESVKEEDCVLLSSIEIEPLIEDSDDAPTREYFNNNLTATEHIQYTDQVDTKYVSDDSRNNADICPSTSQKNIKNETALNIHKRTHNKPRLKRCLQKENTQSREDYKFQCEICAKKFKTGHELKLHSVFHNPRKFKCEFCAKAFYQSFPLKEHLRMHRNERNYVCDRCGKAFVGKRHLETHVAVHSEKSLHACRICGLEFSLPCNLQRHLKRNHLVLEGKIEDLEVNCFYKNNKKILRRKIRQYTCKNCNSEFKSLKSFKEHIAEHPEQKHPICNICGAEFTYFANLDRHRKTAHLVLEGTIEDLEKTTYIRNNKKIVCSKVRYFTCKVCDIEFNSLKKYNVHNAMHIEGKRHVCVVCGVAFSRLRNYNNHMKAVHTSTKGKNY